MRIITLGFCLLLIQACATKQRAVGSGTTVYVEDVSYLRKKTLADRGAVSSNLQEHWQEDVSMDDYDSMKGHLKVELDSIIKINYTLNADKIEYVKGYAVQVYMGNSRSRAYEYVDKLEEDYPDMESVVDYYQPNFKVKIGKFTDRLEVYKFYGEVKKYYPKSLIIPERISVSY